eukprot:GHVQ01013691.1.p1 GENE.GHVQ01013691.1~~GHVQ01013691.1.p1  ORF type:complete len:595 (+),score=47.53 GHVQ01013691.1:495-2279(+)
MRRTRCCVRHSSSRHVYHQSSPSSLSLHTICLRSWCSHPLSHLHSQSSCSRSAPSRPCSSPSVQKRVLHTAVSSESCFAVISGCGPIHSSLHVTSDHSKQRCVSSLGVGAAETVLTQQLSSGSFVVPFSPSTVVPSSRHCFSSTSAGRSRGSGGTSEPDELAVDVKGRIPSAKEVWRGPAKPHVVLLGTGWAGVHFLRHIDTTKYDVSILSPRNYFTFTPLLPSVCSGTLSPLACIEPIRTFTKHPQNSIIDRLSSAPPSRSGSRQNYGLAMDFFEAHCQHVDLERKQIECSTKPGLQFKLNYDYLVLSVGAETNTFGIKGVKEYSYFLKEVEHAQAIRKQVMSNFEVAALPVVTDEERKRLLHFVIVGGGPTGVETAAEFADFIDSDMSKYFPDLIPKVTISLVEAQDKILPMFSEKVSKFTANLFQRRLKVNLLLEHAVTEIKEKTIVFKNNTTAGQGKIEEIPYGFVLWASGVAQVPLCKHLMDIIPEQKGNRVLEVNQQLRVLGTNDVYAMGDCSRMQPRKLQDSAHELYSQAAGSPYSASTEWLSTKAPELRTYFPQLSELKWDFKKHAQHKFTEDAFKEYLGVSNASC